MPLSAPRTEISGDASGGRLVRQFLEQYPAALLLEAGEVLFDLREASYEIDETGGRTLLHLWSQERNMVRRLVKVKRTGGVLHLATQRLGQRQSVEMELVAAHGSRALPLGREHARQCFVRTLGRVLSREFPEWSIEAIRSAMDLEHSFGPAFTRGLQVRGQRAWAFVGISGAETASVVEGLLSVGILWLTHMRAQAGNRRVLTGLRLIVPRGQAAATQSRMAWLDERIASYELYELDESTERLRRCDPHDRGNLATRLLRAPDVAAALAPEGHFAEALPRVLALLPQPTATASLVPGPTSTASLGRSDSVAEASAARRLSAVAGGVAAVFAARGVELRLRSGAELAFLRYGLEFARIRLGYAGSGFNRLPDVTVGSGAQETRLTAANAGALRELIGELFTRRSGGTSGEPAQTREPILLDAKTKATAAIGRSTSGLHKVSARSAVSDPLFRQQPERWLESLLRADLAALDASLCADPVYVQVGALSGAHDRGMLDLLAVTRTHRLAVIEVKTEEDLHLALQGLDYWIRVQHHHLANVDRSSGLGDLQRQGYFPETRLSAELPLLLLVAPALHIHPATEIILRHLHPAVDWQLIALDERWRTQVRPIWRRRAHDREQGRGVAQAR